LPAGFFIVVVVVGFFFTVVVVVGFFFFTVVVVVGFFLAVVAVVFFFTVVVVASACSPPTLEVEVVAERKAVRVVGAERPSDAFVDPETVDGVVVVLEPTPTDTPVEPELVELVELVEPEAPLAPTDDVGKLRCTGTGVDLNPRTAARPTAVPMTTNGVRFIMTIPLGGF
jgi:hypothetical protein